MRLEDELVLTAVRNRFGRESVAEELADLIRAGPEWPYVLTSAWSHGVAPLVYKALAEIPESVPEDFLQRFRRAFHQQALIARMQIDELHGVLDLLAAAGVEAVVFKGAALGVQGYGNPTFRKPGDLDLLIRKADFPAAGRALQDAGFRPHVAPDEEEEYLAARGGTVLSRGSTQVDLHWTLEQQRFDSLPFSFPLSTDQIFSNSIEVTLEGRSIRTLSPEHHLLFVCFHGTKHFWQKLYLVCDVAALIRFYPDLPWSEVVEEADRMRISRMLHLGLMLADIHLGAPVPEWILADARRDPAVRLPARKANGWLFSGEDPDVTWHLFRLSMLESVPEKLSYVVNRGMRKLSKMEWKTIKLGGASGVTTP